MSTTARSTGSAFLFSAIFAVATLISGWIYGASLGARDRVDDIHNDFWGSWPIFSDIARSFNSFFAGIAFSCFGVILGAAVGLVIGVLASRYKYGPYVAIAIALAMPVLT